MNILWNILLFTKLNFIIIQILFSPLVTAGSIDTNQENQVYNFLFKNHLENVCKHSLYYHTFIIEKHYISLEKLVVDLKIPINSCKEILEFTEIFLRFFKIIENVYLVIYMKCEYDEFIYMNKWNEKKIIDFIISVLQKKSNVYINEKDEYLIDYCMNDYFEKRLNILSIYCEVFLKIIHDVDYNILKDINYNNFSNLYTFIKTFSRSLAFNKDQTLKFNDIFIFTTELMIFKIANRRKINIFVVYISNYNANNDLKKNKKDPVYILSKFKDKIKTVFKFYKKRKVIETIFFTIVLSHLIHSSNNKSREMSESTFTTENPDIFKQIINTSSNESKKLNMYSENIIFYTLCKYLNSKKNEYLDIKNELMKIKKNLKNEKKRKLTTNSFEEKEELIKLAEKKDRIYKRRDKFRSTFMNDLITFVRQNYMQKTASYFENMGIYRINKFFILFEIISTFYLSVNAYYEDQENNLCEKMKTYYNKVLICLFLNDQNIVEPLLKNLELIEKKYLSSIAESKKING